MPAEVLQEPRQPQDHGVVSAADVGAVQHGAARAGCCGCRCVPVTPAQGPQRKQSRARPSGALCSGGTGSGDPRRQQQLSPSVGGLALSFRKGEGVRRGECGEQPPSPHEDQGRSLEGGDRPGHGRRPQDTPTSWTRGASSALMVEGRALGCRRSGPGAEGNVATPALAHVPSRARLTMASRRASTAGKCRPLAGCTTSMGPSDTWDRGRGK